MAEPAFRLLDTSEAARVCDALAALHPDAHR